MKGPKQYWSIIQNLPEAIFTCDKMGFIKLYNKDAVSLWAGSRLWVKIYDPARGKYIIKREPICRLKNTRWQLL
jgi:hypothetical protein